VNGALIGAWAAVIPSVEAYQAVGHGTFGLALLAMAAGALAAMPLAGFMVTKVGSRAVTVAAALGDCLAATLPVASPSLPTLVVALFLFGMANGAMDVAMNAHGVAVETRLKRPIMSSLHGLYSVGALLGAAAGALIMPAAGPVGLVLAVSGAMALLTLGLAPFLLHGSVDTEAGGPLLAMPDRAVLGLGTLAFLALMSEGAIVDWCGIYLRSVLGATPSVSAAGFAVFAAAMAAGRLSGDLIRARTGAVPLVAVSAGLSAAGVGLFVLAPSAGLAMGGLLLAGLGVANVVPVIFGAAGSIPGRSPGLSIAAMTTMGYVGFLVGPVLIGQVAEATTLGVALGLLAAALVVVAAMARLVRVR
jgi:predicted MFS family arabinose efflux permease